VVAAGTYTIDFNINSRDTAYFNEAAMWVL
jgi:hypothetical protein